MKSENYRILDQPASITSYSVDNVDEWTGLDDLFGTAFTLAEQLLGNHFHLNMASIRLAEIDDYVGHLISIDSPDGRAAIFFGEHETLAWKE